MTDALPANPNPAIEAFYAFKQPRIEAADTLQQEQSSNPGLDGIVLASGGNSKEEDVINSD